VLLCRDIVIDTGPA